MLYIRVSDESTCKKAILIFYPKEKSKGYAGLLIY